MKQANYGREGPRPFPVFAFFAPFLCRENQGILCFG